MVGKWFNLSEFFGGFHKGMGNFGPHLHSANQGLRQWKRSIPSRNARQVGGGDGFMGSSSRIRWISVAASDSGAHVFDPALAATAFEVGGLGLDDTTLKWQEIKSDEGYGLTVVTGETTRPYCPGWNLASPAQKRCSAFFFCGGEMLGGNGMWGNFWRK